MTNDHGEGITGKKNCKCEPCIIKFREARNAYSRKYRKANRELLNAAYNKRRKTQAKINSELPVRRWTNNDDEFLVRSNLTELQTAVVLNRTLHAVRSRKDKLRSRSRK